MISLQAPWWLILLVLIALIRWLHRFRLQSRTFAGTTLFLWQTLPHRVDSDGTPARPDPRWLLRALISSLLILSLAQPGLQSHSGYTIEVWLDDSLSMYAQEEDQTRMQIAIQKLLPLLNDTEATDIQLHSLANPALSLLLDRGQKSAWSVQLRTWSSRPRGEPSPPSAASLSPDSRHILLTDGADNRLNSWAQSAPLFQLIRSGETTQSIALTALSLRASLNASDNISGLARIDNLGDSPQKTRLILQQAADNLETRLLDIPASGYSTVTFSIPAGDSRPLQASIESSNDALTLDNDLQLDPAALEPALRYAKQGSCGPYFDALLDSQASFIRVERQADIIIDCSGQLNKTALPTLRLHPPHAIRHTTQSAHRHDGFMATLHLPAGLAYSDKAPPLGSDAIPILSADERLLILQQRGFPESIDSYLDSSDPLFARQAEFPLLMLTLIEQLSGRSLEFAPLSVSRNSAASRIAPVALPDITAPPVQSRAQPVSLTPWLLLASVLLLLLDAVLAFGPLQRLSKQRA